MQLDSYPNTVDPRLLSLKEYAIPHPNTAHGLAIADEDVDDDIEIASGQVDPEDGVGSLGTYQGIKFDGQSDLAAELDWSDTFDISDSQALSATPRTGGFGGFYSGFAAGEEGSSSSNDPEPWHHLKPTSAISVSDPVGRSSRECQVDPYCLRSSSPLGLSDSRLAANTSNPHFHRRRRTSASDQSTQDPQAPPQPQSIQAATVQTPSLSQLRRQQSSRHDQGRGESSISSTSSPTPFPDLEIDDILSQSSYSNATYTLWDRTLSNEDQEQIGDIPGILGDGPEETAQELDLTPEPGWYTNSPGQMGPYEGDWRQKQTLSSVGNQFFDSRATYQGIQDHQHPSNDLHHSDAVMIPRAQAASEHYDSHRSSSFPTTAGHLPPDVVPVLSNFQAGQARQIQRPRRDTDSALRPASLPMRRKISNRSARASRSGSLSIIREGNQNSLSASPMNKGRRSGPLTPGTKEEAKQKRLNKNVCIKCHMMKSGCKGELPCEGCRKNLNAKPGAHPCMQSHFLGLVEQGTLNAVFQRSICPSSVDGQERLTFSYNSTFNVGELLSRLENSRFSYNVQVRTWNNYPYTVDLARCFGILSRFQEHPRLEMCELDDFMDNRYVKVFEWLECLGHYDQNFNVVDQSIHLNDMPSRNSYYHLSLDRAGYAQPLNIYNVQDVECLLFAVQLTRIILRALELEAYAALQRSISEFPKLKDDAAMKLLNGQLGSLLLSLRWRIAWWASFGHRFEQSQESRMALTDRAKMLTHVLYCYFFITKKKLGSRDSSSPDQARSSYGHSEPAFTDLPRDDSAEGFNSWMQSGQAQLQQYLGILSHFSSIYETKRLIQESQHLNYAPPIGYRLGKATAKPRQYYSVSIPSEPSSPWD